MNPIIASAPTRVDLAGGTLDLWPLHHFISHKATVNIAVNLRAQAELSLSKDEMFYLSSVDRKSELRGTFAELAQPTRLPLLSLMLASIWGPHLPAISLATKAQCPAGAGLGGSSALAIACAAALFRARNKLTGQDELHGEDLVAFVQNLESRLIHCPTGCQDYWGAVNGGLNIISYPFEGTKGENSSHDSLTWFNERTVLVFSGKSRDSGINNWEIFKKLMEKNQEALSAFAQIGQLSEQCGEAARARDWELVMDLSKKEWSLRKELWPKVETDETRGVERIALEAGASFVRVCGAGGGGVMAVFCQKNKQSNVAEALNKKNFEVLQAQLACEGLRISD